jgi:hypothetical protein
VNTSGGIGTLQKRGGYKKSVAQPALCHLAYSRRRFLHRMLVQRPARAAQSPHLDTSFFLAMTYNIVSYADTS